MKKLFKTAVLLVIAMVLIPACSEKKDDDNGNEIEKTPKASFTLSSDEVSVNDTVYFTNESVNAESYKWNFGDGSAISTDFEPVYSYSNAGNYTITLTAYSVDGTKSDTASADIQVKDNQCPSNLVFQVGGVSFEMIYVEGGTFTMGATPEQENDPDADEYPAHQVTLSDYYIGKYEVTQALWQAVMGTNPSFYSYGSNYPVEEVSWTVIVEEFLPALNAMTGRTFVLPTEAQWEFAARGGNESQHYKYSGSNQIDDVAWYEDNSDDQTHPVGQKQANELGIYDMSGNVNEWCYDFWDLNYYQNSSSVDPQGPATGLSRVYRGGSWITLKNCRVSNRDYYSPGIAHDDGGFRLGLLP